MVNPKRLTDNVTVQCRPSGACSCKFASGMAACVDGLQTEYYFDLLAPVYYNANRAVMTFRNTLL